MSRTTIIIADDHTMVRDGLKQLLDSQPDMQVVAEAGDGILTLEKVRTFLPDVIVLDVSMPKMGGIESIPLIRNIHPEICIIILSMYEKETFAHEALKAGAHAYILKGNPSQELLKAIRAVREGDYYFSRQIHTTVIDSYVHKRKHNEINDEGYQSLSDREKQVFKLLIEGNSTALIASLLCISPKTAEKHRTSVVKKLKLSNVVELMKYAIRIGLVDPDSWRS